MSGVCVKVLVVGDEVSTTISYADDTGLHDATVLSASSTQGDVLTVVHDDVSAVRLVASRPGDAGVVMTVEHWDTQQVFPFRVVASAEALSDEERKYYEGCNLRGLGSVTPSQDAYVKYGYAVPDGGADMGDVARADMSQGGAD